MEENCRRLKMCQDLDLTMDKKGLTRRRKLHSEGIEENHEEQSEGTRLYIA